MADESWASASTTTINAPGGARDATHMSNAPPPSFTVRRAATFGQPPTLRRPLSGNDMPSPTENRTFTNIRRRSSVYSDYLETSADELLNPSKPSTEEDPKSPFVYIPLILALLPAIAGVFFENGAPFFTDLILLSLAAVFLHWSVTQPWHWYHSAQQVRVVQDENLSDSVFELDSNVNLTTTPSPAVSPTNGGLDDVPEEQGKEGSKAEINEPPVSRNARREAQQAAAIGELYIHELVALAWCFIFPMLGAYLLHTIRSQLSRPSEGLVSDYNLTIFLCAAEVRPVSHLFRMLQQRTLHVQAIVAQNPHAQKAVTDEQIQALCSRLDELEAREAQKDSTGSAARPEAPPKMVESAVGREFSKSVQPELEALNRAMRRYEKKLTLLASQTDNRIEYVEYRLNDAIALAAVAAKSSHSWGLAAWLAERTAAIVLLPIQAVATVVTFPLRTMSMLFRWKGQAAPEKAQRSLRNGKSPSQGRSSSDRVPTRVSRR